MRLPTLATLAVALLAGCGGSDRITADDLAAMATAAPLPAAATPTFPATTPTAGVATPAPAVALATPAVAVATPEVVTSTPAPTPAATPTPTSAPRLADLTVRLLSEDHASLTLGLYSCQVEVANASGVPRSGTVTVTFVHEGSPEAGSSPQTQDVDVPAGGTATLTFTDAKWHLLSETAQLAVTTAPYQAGAAAPRPVSFQLDVAPVFQQRCSGCHASGQQGASAVQLFSAPGQVDRVVVSGAIARILSACQSGDMPRGGSPLTSAELSALERWQAAGMPAD